jgi:trk system potassium uptake protein TrkA
MYIIVVGCGRVGSQLATLLSAEGHDVVVVDNRPDSFRRLGAVFNGVTIVGEGLDEEVLRKAGIEKAEAFAAVTHYDNTNIMAAQVAKQIFNVPKVIARLYNPDRQLTYQRLGLEIICGTTMVATVVKNRLLQNTVTSHIVFGQGEVEIVEFQVSKATRGKKISELEILHEFSISCILRDNKAFIPLRETTVEEGDILISTIKTTSLPKVKKLFELKELSEVIE